MLCSNLSRRFIVASSLLLCLLQSSCSKQWLDKKSEDKTDSKAPSVPEEEAQPPIDVTAAQFRCEHMEGEASNVYGCLVLIKGKKVLETTFSELYVLGPDAERYKIDSFKIADADSKFSIIVEIPQELVGKTFNFEAAFAIQGSTRSLYSCPDGYVFVPGDPVFNTDDFCVMKYEAKEIEQDGKRVIRSRPDGELMQLQVGSIEDAKTLCSGIGSGFSWMNNAEWMTIAANIASNDENWSGGKVGEGTINKGHSDGFPNAYINASSDDRPYEGTMNDGEAGPLDWSQKRTHVLTNGDIIWDLSGNAKEFLDTKFEDVAVPSFGKQFEYVEINQVNDETATKAVPASFIRPTSKTHPWWDDHWDSNQGLGKYYPSTCDGKLSPSVSLGFLARGGVFGTKDTSAVGIFEFVVVELYDTDPFENAGLFRCVFRSK